MKKQTVTLLVPTKEQIDALVVGDPVLDSFGNKKRIVEITARENDVNGRRFVCFTHEFGPNSTCSGSMKEGELVRTVALSNHFNAAETAKIESAINAGALPAATEIAVDVLKKVVDEQTADWERFARRHQ